MATSQKPAHHPLRNAAQAKIHSEKIVNGIVKEQLNYISDLIHEACENGEMKIYRSEDMHPRVKKHLESLGYEIIVEEYFVISWENAPWQLLFPLYITPMPEKQVILIPASEAYKNTLDSSEKLILSQMTRIVDLIQEAIGKGYFKILFPEKIFPKNLVKLETFGYTVHEKGYKTEICWNIAK